MNRKLIVALFTLALGFATAPLAVATDGAKPDEPKAPMFSAKCKSPCSFNVRSHDRQEVASVLQEHTRTHHNGLAMSDADADAKIKTVAAKK